MLTALLSEEGLVAAAFENAIVSTVAVAVADIGTVASNCGKIESSLKGGDNARRFLTNTTRGLADCLPIFDLAATRLGALAVSLPDPFVVAKLGDVVGGVALGLSWRAFDLLVAVCVASRTNMAGARLVTRLDSVPALDSAQHD